MTDQNLESGQSHSTRSDVSLSKADMQLLVDQALVLIEGFYVHMPLKKSYACHRSSSAAATDEVSIESYARWPSD